ncbi:ABC transporter ATP-binding protein [Aquincola sp. S2]|uniref:ABC transporter ATP-binding protein n=1 Tax=Pseudaquabacterium terrae TaxID=2732868 RepID=A0ABX2EFP5_9BURK|nr:ABC transporter ATP-binding protein [Aquabacterium terrae]NRF67455.1 ABC transporter ATP-binding protein [Aquabacterium terrae]
MASISLQGITKRFGDITAVDDMRLDIADGEFFVLLGPSGAGKTTTLRLIAGLETPDAGQLRMNGADLTAAPPAQRDCAFVFQQYSLYPHLSVYDNMAFPLRAPMRRMDEAEIRRRVERVAAVLHIESKLQRKSTALSGGEMQRVAIGRALVREPRVYLMDEPLSSLDAGLREELRVELKRLQRASGATVVYVTHDQVEATTLADRIAILEHGRIAQVGTPLEIYDQPQSLEVAQRLGSPAINVLPAAWFAGSVVPHAKHVAIRPEDVELSPDGDGSQAYAVIECSLVKHLIVAERSGVEVRARSMLDQALVPGARVQMTFPPERCMFFDGAGQRLAASR